MKSTFKRIAKAAAWALVVVICGVLIFINWPLSEGAWGWLGLFAFAIYAAVLIGSHVNIATQRNAELLTRLGRIEELMAGVGPIEERLARIEGGMKHLAEAIGHEELKLPNEAETTMLRPILFCRPGSGGCILRRVWWRATDVPNL